jgi:hypothetical protein
MTIVRDRSDLRIADLKRRRPAATRLMNVKVPGHILEAIERMAQELDTTKTAVVIALLEAGIEQGEKSQKK